MTSGHQGRRNSAQAIEGKDAAALGITHSRALDGRSSSRVALWLEEASMASYNSLVKASRPPALKCTPSLRTASTRVSLSGKHALLDAPDRGLGLAEGGVNHALATAGGEA